jgi:uncharacterized membrane protein YhiD involved in acid resistance
MPEWLQNAFPNGQSIQVDVLFVRLVLAAVLGGAIALIYWWTHRRDETLTPSFLSTLVLLAILIAMVTQVIGDNVARAFSLVGALSIVRFRTVVEDTRDTAFVIFSVIVGMAVGAGYMVVALAGLVVVGLAAAVVRPRHRAPQANRADWSLSVRVSVGQGPETLLAGIFGKHLEEAHLLSTSTGRQGAALDLAYRVRLRATATPITLIDELNQLPGVQNAELRRL